MSADEDDDLQYAEYASPPCFLHELQPEFRPGRMQADMAAWVDVARWRKAERKRLIDERLAVPPDARRARSDRIAAALSATLGDPKKHLVSVYWPIRGEPDLRQWMVDITKNGGRIALPVVIPKGWPLEFRSWAPGDPLERGIWNILVPSRGPAVQPAVVIAPVVGFDPNNYRLGFGGGFFDRTLAAMPAKPRVIGVGFARSRLASIYPQPHDIPMDMIVTDE
jgi:5,10-methenyltetrahydrofolate synthetase